MEKGHCFENEIMKCIHALYSIIQSTTIQSQCKRFNCTVHYLLKAIEGVETKLASTPGRIGI